jgi:hypothetical protein
MSKKEIDHPISDEKISSMFPEYFRLIIKRLRTGADQYGDGSFSADPAKLCEELEQEVLDIAGWSFPIWCRIQDLKLRLKSIEEKLH